MSAPVISPRAFQMIRAHEGCPTRVIRGVRMAVPYRCPANVWTIGFGFITLNGRPVTGTTRPLTMAEVESEFAKQLATYVTSVVNDTSVPLNPDQAGALASFAYNVGKAAYRSSTLRKRINAGRWDDVEHQFCRWNKANGRVLAGLTKRRKEEAHLFLASRVPTCATCHQTLAA